MRHLSAFVLLLVVAPSLGAQDVEMLGARYGTPVPDGYYRTMAADNEAFQYERGWIRRGADPQLFRGALLLDGPQPLGPRSGPVVGTFDVPVVMGLYGNSVSIPPYDSLTVADAYFGPGDGTITHYYTEVSGGRVTLNGDIFDWVQTASDDSTYTQGESGLTGGAGDFIKDLLDLQPPTDWGRYDNDGPDGLPNSGDDDGFVDVIAAMHPESGAECGGSGRDDRIWSHRWSLRSATGSFYTTDTPSANGGFIVINDYTIQPSLSCSGGNLSPIGVFTHELGHAFGLPDLYDTCSDVRFCPDDVEQVSGAGTWDLMSSGSWGCNNASASLPCHMGAWSKAALGWVDVVTLAPDVDHDTLTLEPVTTSGQVYRVDAADGSGEYFLLENRQRTGYDGNLYSEGLLIWHVSPQILATEWPRNRVNAANPMGVWLRQADGAQHLNDGVGRGDAGDPFPGFSGNDVFHTASTPSSLSTLGGVSGLTIYDIEATGDDITFGLTTRMSTVTVRADGASTTDGLFTIDGDPTDPPATTFPSAPFVPHTIEVVSGESGTPGVRTPFVGWADDPAASRVREVTTPLDDVEYVANFSGTEYELSLALQGGVNGVEPATLTSTPSSSDLWFEDGANVTLEAVPQTGFSFLQWTGALAGQPNPAVFSMTGPLQAGADFELTYSVGATDLEVPAATPLDIQLEVSNGTDPVRWSILSGTLPEGLALSPAGQLTGSALELGSWTLVVEAVDGLGLPGSAELTIELVAPDIPIEQLASSFLLSGPELTQAQLNFLNLQGNGVAFYDIGDFRAWVLSNPALPMSALVLPETHRATVVVPVRPGREGSR